MADQLERLADAVADRYAVERELGAGGMATVYLAQDLKHSRKVAVKVLRSDLASSIAGERFLREIEIASQLTHPHILPLHDSGAADGGRVLYYVMPYVDGESLAHRMRREGILSLEYALQVAREVAAALDFAHRHNIVHRDIKPANILLADGHAVVADFGIARALGAAGGFAITQTGAPIGTPRYWSPEQALGTENVDGRTDIHSLGRVLYEMLVGDAPVSACDRHSVEQGCFIDLPPSHKKRLGEVPVRVVRALVRALAADPAQRFATAQEFAEQLAPPQRGTNVWGAAGDVASSPFRAARVASVALIGVAIASVFVLVRAGAPAVAPGGVAAVLLAGALTAGLMVMWQRRERVGQKEAASIPPVRTRSSVAQGGSDSGAVDSIAVLPFADLSPQRDQEYFSDGMAEELLNALAKIQGLRVAARTSSFHFKDKNVDVRTIGEQLGVETILEGSVRKSDARVRITAQLVNASDGFHLWSETFDRELADVFAIQEEIAGEIVRALSLKLPGASGERDVTQRAPDPEAHNLYLMGRHLWNQRTKAALEKAAEYFTQATERDPSYAAAHAGLADAYLMLGSYHHMPPREALPLAKAAAERALALDERLAEAHATRGQVLRSELDWRGEEQEYQRAIQLNPNYPTVHQWYATVLTAMGRTDEAHRHIRRAMELDPFSPAIGITMAAVLLMTGQVQQAITQLERTREIAPNLFAVQAWLVLSYVEAGRLEDALRAGQRSRELNNIVGTRNLALVQAKLGNRDEALRLLELASQPNPPWPVMAAVYTALGETENALSALESAFDEEGWSFFTMDRAFLLYLNVTPWFASMRSEPRFQALVERLRFPSLRATA